MQGHHQHHHPYHQYHQNHRHHHRYHHHCQHHPTVHKKHVYWQFHVCDRVCVYVFFTVARERSFPKLTSHAGTWHAHKHTLKDSKKYLCLKLWRWQRQWRVISLQVGSDILLSFSLFSIQYPCKLSMCTQDSACKIALASLRHWCQSQHVKSDIRLEMDVVRMDRACVRPVW